MTLLQQGGTMMWPLILLSVPALGVILERLCFFGFNRFPSPVSPATETLRYHDKAGPFLSELQENESLFLPFFNALVTEGPVKQREERAAMAAKEILFAFGKRLDFLSSVATTAPLLGLLGTVVGMVEAFSKLAGANGGMDISLLANGIWHALLTTAAGLVIAIPSLMAHQWFCTQQRQTAFAMERLANHVISQSETLP
jgi:biopolymer transport protein ExbB